VGSDPGAATPNSCQLPKPAHPTSQQQARAQSTAPPEMQLSALSSRAFSSKTASSSCSSSSSRALPPCCSTSPRSVGGVELQSAASAGSALVLHACTHARAHACTHARLVSSFCCLVNPPLLLTRALPPCVPPCRHWRRAPPFSSSNTVCVCVCVRV